MKVKLLGLVFIMLSFCINCQAQTVVWSGEVSSNGSPSEAIPLIRNEKYQIKVSGVINLGKWKQVGHKLANDACYEFVADSDRSTSQNLAIKNSMDISVCDGKFHSDHIYQSSPFVAEQNKIHFWINDFDYEDNSGAFRVQIIHLKPKK